MPQMAPLLWINLFLSTLFVLILVSVYIYFMMKNTSSELSSSALLSQTKKWMW